MGLFDRFKKRFKSATDDIDIDELTADEESPEAAAALAEKERRDAEKEAQKKAEEEWESLDELDSIEPSEPQQEEWDDWDDEPVVEPVDKGLEKKERKRLKKERRDAEKARKQLKQQGFDVDQQVRPDGSRVDLSIMRSTTGRKLVDVKSAPRGSSGPKKVETKTGTDLEIDLGGGVVEKGGRIIKDGPAMDAMMDEFELIMLEADMSRGAIDDLLNSLRAELIGSRLRRGADLGKVVEASLKRAIRALLTAGYWDFFATVDSLIENGDTPVIIAVVGINGVGKTTQIGKLGHHLKSNGKRVVFAAADTFRAGAIDQLSTHAERLEIKCISSQRGGDSAAIARDAIEHARARRLDVAIIDTAGRMQNKTNLMEELRKLHRVTKPHLVMLVVDALAGNDATEQAKVFQEILNFDGIILAKMDVDPKAGCALSLSHATSKPVVLAGIGQKYEDLRSFDADWLIDEVFS